MINRLPVQLNTLITVQWERLGIFPRYHSLKFKVFKSRVGLPLHICIDIYAHHSLKDIHVSACQCTHTHTNTHTQTHNQRRGVWVALPKEHGWDQQLRVLRYVLPKHNSRLHGRPEKDTQTNLFCLKACGQAEIPHSNARCADVILKKKKVCKKHIRKQRPEQIWSKRYL